MNQTTNCHLCGKDAQLVEEKLPGYQEPDTFAIYECSNCNTQFPYPRVETGPIYELIYKNAERVMGYDRYFKYRKEVKSHVKPLKFLTEKEEAYWVVNNVLEQDIFKKKTVKILEVGCGMGYLTYSLKKEGFNITGLDISQKAIDEAIVCFGEYFVCANVFDYAKNHKEEYDYIIFTQVFEHVEEPLKWLETLLLMLNKDGKIILTTENKSIYPEKTIWQSDLPPVHLWWFSEQSMKYIANKLNVAISFIDFSKYKGKEKGIDIVPVEELKPRFKKNGEPIQKDNLFPRNYLLKKAVKKIKILESIYLIVNPIYMKYLRNSKWNSQVKFGVRRGIMGCVLKKTCD